MQEMYRSIILYVDHKRPYLELDQDIFIVSFNFCGREIINVCYILLWVKYTLPPVI